MSQEHSPATLSADDIKILRNDLLAECSPERRWSPEARRRINVLCDMALSAPSEIADSPAAKNEGNAALRLLAEVADAMDLSLGDSVSVAKMRPLVLARLESVPSAIEQKPFIRVGEYTIGPRSDGSFWIEHDSGEGMQASKSGAEKLVGDFYKENF